ncbi:Holliday junction branch migration protein RuvA [Salinisphaera orenii]|uniref:Holliday junction branch migration complex subunit RuvA n=1 Tax=Salinisphaera orenii YIM 95161 TaxID=1051139 RepID=A0A423PM75_9GAMM|nr:Holliday junction branch migration protein RuvA [Salinisphaera halophila]ROO26710.1 Holliday junction DNA helicase RuvA [Salinisphaera halophila YIM 95161]
MIGRLRGHIVEKQPPRLVLDVGGVGYELEAPMSTFFTLGQSSGEVTLLTQMVVREDALLLYGFASADERSLFRELIKVSGVGAKLALTVLSGMSVADFVATIEADDAARLTGLPGVGKKTAARLLVEMRDKLSGTGLAPALSPTPAAADGTAAGNAIDDARHALMALGYKPAEADRLMRGLDDEADDSEALIREALRRAVRS